jgi:nucleoid DNA-binding protein
MIKKDIIRAIYDRHGGITLAEAEQYTNTLIDLLKEAVREEDSVVITNFGKFRKKEVKPRNVTLPSGKETKTQGGERLQFIPSPKLKDFLNQKN